MSSNPLAARCRASGAVNAITPLKPGSRSRIRRSSAVERTDFEAMRIGSPPAWASIASRVGSQRVEIDEREGRRDAGEDRVVVGLLLLGVQLAGEGIRITGGAIGSHLESAPLSQERWPSG